MLFYTNRVMESSVIRDPEKLMMSLSSSPEKTWLSSIVEYRKLASQHPEKVYLIQANSKYAFFTSMKNRDHVRYNFSAMQLPLIK
jgi:ssDNA-specific exonuclease RecJ